MVKDSFHPFHSTQRQAGSTVLRFFLSQSPAWGSGRSSELPSQGLSWQNNAYGSNELKYTFPVASDTYLPGKKLPSEEATEQQLPPALQGQGKAAKSITKSSFQGSSPCGSKKAQPEMSRKPWLRVWPEHKSQWLRSDNYELLLLTQSNIAYICSGHLSS